MRYAGVPDEAMDVVPDPEAARTYVLEIENTSCMLITETYRSGMMQGLPLAGPGAQTA